MLLRIYKSSGYSKGIHHSIEPSPKLNSDLAIDPFTSHCIIQDVLPFCTRCTIKIHLSTRDLVFLLLGYVGNTTNLTSGLCLDLANQR